MRRPLVVFCAAVGALAAIGALSVPASASTTSAAKPASAAPAQSATPGVVFRLAKLPASLRRSASGPEISSIPDSAIGCVGNLPQDNIQTCMDIQGSGLYVDYMAATSIVYNYAVVEHVELTGKSVPNGHINSDDYVVQPGEYIQVEWAPHHNESAGGYCADSWELSGMGGYYLAGRACESVIA